MAQQITAQQRNQNFSNATRQKWQSTAVKTGSGAAPGDTVQFDIPKINLTSRIRVLITANLKASHATKTTFDAHPFAPFILIRRITVDLNNGFSPYSLTGAELYMYLLLQPNAHVLARKESGRSKVVMGSKASAAGANNQVSFLMDLPITLNDRDPVGLIVTQNQETTVTVSIDIAHDLKVLTTDPTGLTLDVSALRVEPMVESFSIPPIAEAFPDISVLKLVQATRSDISGPGQHHVALPTGYTYRKLFFYVQDENGNGVDDSALTGNIELVLNQADNPYRVSASHLAKINHEQFGFELPKGMFAFDFSYQGIANLGGLRDYIDTENLTEFWLRYNATAKGTITVGYEMLSRLQGTSK
ncbi:hypothetical protein [Erysipelothrix tonsillarum]|uniref:hypothetical protein n=1 Tax=Erysipelothrix tonsillarum TaxID=38402 RepID=UPI0039C7997E